MISVTVQNILYTVKPVLNGHSKIDKSKILMTNGSKMKVESIAECSPWSILQYFLPALSDNWFWKSIFGLFESGRFRQVCMSQCTTKWPMHPAKIQVSPVWSEYAVLWRNYEPWDMHWVHRKGWIFVQADLCVHVMHMSFCWLCCLLSYWASAWDFQQCGILTCVDSDEPLQLPFKFRNSKWCSVSSLTIIEYSSD